MTMIRHDIPTPSHPFASQSIMDKLYKLDKLDKLYIYIEIYVLTEEVFFWYLKSRQMHCKACQVIHPLLWFERHVVFYFFRVLCFLSFAKSCLHLWLRSSWGGLLISQKEAYLYPFHLSPFLSLLIGMVSRITPMMDGRRLIRHNHTKDKGR